MVSLFVLFSLFYKRSYSKKNKGNRNSKLNASEKESEDQCHKAMREILVAAKEACGQTCGFGDECCQKN